MKKETSNNNLISKMAQRYEKAWHVLFYQLPRWKQQAITQDHEDRYAFELAHEAAKLAESEGFDPIKMVYAGKKEDIKEIKDKNKDRDDDNFDELEE